MEDPPQLNSVMELDLGLDDLDMTSSAEVDLSGLEADLKRFENHEVVRTILQQGRELKHYAKEVEARLAEVELDSIQDYVVESDNLLALHAEVLRCDSVLASMEGMLGGFQADLGSISTEIRSLQEQSLSMSVKLRNRKAAEAGLGRFVEDIALPPSLIARIVDGDPGGDDYGDALLELARKLRFAAEDAAAKKSVALKDVEPELDKLRTKALSKVREYVLGRIAALKRPKANVQILQQTVLLKTAPLLAFVRDHGREGAYAELRATYIEAMSKVLSAHFKTYLAALDRLQLEVASARDLLGAEEPKQNIAQNLFGQLNLPGMQKKDALRNRAAVYVLGERAAVLRAVDAPPLVPAAAESVVGAGGKVEPAPRHPPESLFRSSHKLLCDTATTEYVFCAAYFAGDASAAAEVLGPTLEVMLEHVGAALAVSHDALGLLLMLRLGREFAVVMARRRIPALDAYLDRVNLLLWPRFKVVFDLHLTSLKSANERALWADDAHAHFVVRRYAEFSAALHLLDDGGAAGGDGALSGGLERLRAAAADVILRLARLFPARKKQLVFLINNYDLILSVVREALAAAADKDAAAGTAAAAAATSTTAPGGGDAHGGAGPSGGPAAAVACGDLVAFFESQLGSATTVFVEESLMEHFGKLISFVKKAEMLAKPSGAAGDAPGEVHMAPGYGAAEAEPLVREFGRKWKAAVEGMHKEAMTSFGSFPCGMEILKAAMTQLLLYYTRVLEHLRRCGPSGAAILKEAVTVPSIMYEIKKYSQETRFL